MARQFDQVKLWPFRSPAPVTCIRCAVLVREGEQKRRARARVTAIDITNGGRLPVAYCSSHIPEDLSAQVGQGAGAVICQGCGEPTKNHSLLDNCMEPLIP